MRICLVIPTSSAQQWNRGKGLEHLPAPCLARRLVLPLLFCRAMKKTCACCSPEIIPSWWMQESSCEGTEKAWKRWWKRCAEDWTNWEWKWVRRKMLTVLYFRILDCTPYLNTRHEINQSLSSSVDEVISFADGWIRCQHMDRGALHQCWNIPWRLQSCRSSKYIMTWWPSQQSVNNDVTWTSAFNTFCSFTQGCP